jgi:general secretion pathway protein A
MYKAHFGFREKPFKLVPNPDYLYLSKNHEIAMAHLTYAVSQGDGFVVITGEVGTGKTTLCRIFLEQVDNNVETAYIFNPKLDSVQLLSAICNEFGLRTGFTTVKQLLDVINGYLIMKHQAGRKVILLIDEAQNLSIENLEMVRMLSNLETTRDKLLQIILVGQPELGDKLDSYEMRQLAQRISLSAHLLPLGLEETIGYINHRVNVAAQRQQPLFTRSACRQIFRFSGGIPRLINIACDRSLLTAFSLNKAKVSGGIARIAIRELTSHGRQQKRPAFKHFFSWLMLLLGIVALSGIVYSNSEWIGLARIKDAGDRKQVAQVPAAPAQAAPDDGAQTFKINPLPMLETPAATPSAEIVMTHQQPTQIAAAAQSLDHLESRLHSVASMLKCWGQPPPNKAQLPATFVDSDYFEIAARQYGLRMYTMQSNNWSLVKQLNLPAILSLKKNSDGQTVYMTLVGWRDGQIQLAGPDGREVIQTSLDALLPYMNGPIYFYWKNAIGFDDLISAWSSPKQVGAVKHLLRRVGYDQIDSQPVFDRDTEEAILDFQIRNSLEPDGLVGPLTKIFLIQQANVVEYPRLDEQDRRSGA